MILQADPSIERLMMHEQCWGCQFIWGSLLHKNSFIQTSSFLIKRHLCPSKICFFSATILLILHTYSKLKTFRYCLYIPIIWEVIFALFLFSSHYQTKFIPHHTSSYLIIVLLLVKKEIREKGRSRLPLPYCRSLKVPGSFTLTTTSFFPK